MLTIIRIRIIEINNKSQDNEAEVLGHKISVFIQEAEDIADYICVLIHFHNLVKMEKISNGVKPKVLRTPILRF